ncbi:SDR family NAD(P)-dependent oxidoreductase, partial [Nocardia carnea]|uniref:SDR family NAD(P)-dependent oxidoreductase n=1 Tax=Nocardia carnea TaxID=37328 RepID=UPI0024549DEA
MSVPDVSNKSLAELASLRNRRAVVTGGGRGLGKAIALRLAEAGADVLIGDIDEGLASAAAAEIGERFGVRTLGVAMDVTDADSVASAADHAVTDLGSLDIWVNNAGVFPSVSVFEMSAATWDQVFAVNARGVFLGAREAARHMAAAAAAGGGGRRKNNPGMGRRGPGGGGGVGW